MPRFMHLFLLCIAGTCYSLNTLSAQNQLWQRKLSDDLYNVSWIEQTNEGYILAAGDKGLMALDYQTGNTIWKNTDLKAINRNTFQLIPELPYFIIEATSLLGKSKSLIVNSSNGTIVFDSKDEDLKIGSHHIFPEIQSILFEVKQEGMNKLLLFNYAESNKKWLVEVGKASGGLKSIIRKSKGLTSFMLFTPKLINQKQLLVTENTIVSLFDIATGKKQWSVDMEDKLNASLYSPIDDKVYLGIKKKISVIQREDCKDVTDSKLKLGSSLEQIFANESGQLVMVASDGFNILDTKTGKFIWKKSFENNGLSKVIQVDDDYYALGVSDKSSVLARVDGKGNKVWKENLDGYAYYMKPIKKGIFYLSTEKSNIISYDKGDKIWKKDLKFKSIPAMDVDEEHDEVVFYEGDECYKFNLQSGELDAINDQVKFKKKGDLDFFAEVIPSGYFIYSSQHTALVDRKGNLKYINFYKPVSSTDLSGLAQFAGNVAGLDLDIKGTMESIKNLDALSHGALRTAGDQTEGSSVSTVVTGLYVGDNPVFEIIKSRTYNSKKTKDYQFILADMEADGNQIIMVNKGTGAIDNKIVLKDKTPSYVIDAVDNIVYVNESNKVVAAYKMK